MISDRESTRKLLNGLRNQSNWSRIGEAFAGIISDLLKP